MPQRREAMKAIYKVMLPTVVSIAMLDSAVSSAMAQMLKQELVGTWEVVSVVNDNNGKKSEPYGSHPMGYLMFDPGGHVSLQIMRSDIPKVASNNKDCQIPQI